MNDQLKDLEAQCWVERSHGSSWFNAELFARLIIKECVDVAMNAASDTTFATGLSSADTRAIAIGVQIMNHFGNKE